MFFERDSESTDRRSVNVATFLTFAFWGSFLLFMSIYSMWVLDDLYNIHSVILFIGLVIFFTTRLFIEISQKRK
ncbi:hypothetical protein JOD17_000029 [Geomicrobium sediminis]|uniref:Uncharacterized protein n=1 Tax=Geomicrobium sediminis TaxID=1347788 RepID=A0ABS2P6C0_9BACL|nr:hypothetical protein [Geomicrobium sediminis]